MKNLKAIVVAFLFSSCILKAQDSTKLVTQEIGFNTVLLVKQLISNNPANTLGQLPYSIFYNLYYKDVIGLRVGLGFTKSKNEISIDGQNLPRNTETSNSDLRTGISYNFVNKNRVTLNVFGDYLFQGSKVETINTTTIQNIPDPIQKITVVSSDITKGSGGQVGVGVKYNLYKHISIYAEVPFSFMSSTTTSEVTISETGEPTEKTSSTSKNSFTRITIPTTIYLVLRF